MADVPKTNRDILGKPRIFAPQGPLAGFRVLDFSQVLASPYLGTMLSDMGAEVIKVEASYGDSSRAYGPLKEGEAGYYITQNRGKYGICMDLTHPKAIEICKELARICDICIENWRPGIMAKRGLSYADLRSVNPGIIYASVSGFGNFDRYAPAPGPYSPRVCYDVIAQAESGHQWMNGFTDKAPHGLDVSWSDLNTGTHEAVAIVAALIQRQKTGRGQWIDIALTDSMIASNENLICSVSMDADDVPSPVRNGLRRLSLSPYGVFKASDDYFVIGVDNDKRFARLCEAMGKPELARDPKFDTNQHRLQNRAELEGMVEEWCAQRTVEKCVTVLRDQHSVPAGPILTNTQYVNHPHYRERGMLVPIEQARAGTFDINGVVSKLSHTPGRVQGAAPLMGEHNRYVLKKYLGYSEKEVDKLYADLVVVDNLDMEYGYNVDVARAKAKERGGEL